MSNPSTTLWRAFDRRNKRVSRLSPGSIGGCMAAASFCFLVSCAGVAHAQLPTTELNGVYPPGGKLGTEVEVTVSGNNQDDLTALLFSHPGITAEQKQSEPSEFLGEKKPVNNGFLVKIGGDVPPGVYEARVVGRFGVSNPRAFVVGSLDELVDDNSNKKIDAAREIMLGTVINGRVDASSMDYYKVTLKAGQRIIVDCWAKRIDSKMDGALVLYDSDGGEIRRNRDLQGSDPLLDFTAEQDGDYVIAVYDFLYGGGADYFYRLAIHNGPHVDFVFPPAGLAGSTETYQVYGRNLPGGKPVPDFKLDGVALEQVTVQVALPERAGELDVVAGAHPRQAALDVVRTPATINGQALDLNVALAAAPVVAETEPNDDPAKAQRVSIPCEYVGQFHPARDRDWVEFEAKQGEVFLIDVVCHQSGSGCDPYFTLQQVTKNDKGEETVKDLAQVDDPSDRASRIGSNFDTSTDDPSYRFQAPADGLYRIMVRDQFGGSTSDPRAVYRLRILPYQGDFRLVAWPEQIKVANNNQVLNFSPVVRQGGTTPIKLEVIRSGGFDGEIQVDVEGLPEGVSCDGAVISGATRSAWLVLTATENAAAWQGPIRIVGTADQGGETVQRVARGGSVTWSTTNRTQALPTFRLTRDLVLSVVDQDKAAAQVRVGDGTMLETSMGGKIEVPVKISRYGNFKENVKLVATGMPAEIKPGDITINGDKADGKLTIAITNAKAKPGAYTFFLRGDTKFPKWERNPAAIKSAEEQQKKLQEVVGKLNEEVKSATAANTESAKKAQAATTALKTAETEKANSAKQLQAAQATEKQTADKLAAATQAQEKAPDDEGLKSAAEAAKTAHAAAAAKLKTAQEAAEASQKKVEEAKKSSEAAALAKTNAEKELKELQEKVKRAAAAKKTADTNLANVKKANAAKDVNIALVSTPIRLRIVASPVQLTGPERVSVKAEGVVEIPISVERKYGFEDAVALSVQPPKGVAGISAAKLSIAKGMTEGKLVLKAAKNATVGEHKLAIEGQLKFNNVTIKSPTEVVVQVEAAAEAK